MLKMEFGSSQRMDGIWSHGTSWDHLQVNAAGEWKEPEALGLNSGPHSTVRIWRDKEVPQKRVRRFHGREPRDVSAAK